MSSRKSRIAVLPHALLACLVGSAMIFIVLHPVLAGVCGTTNTDTIDTNVASGDTVDGSCAGLRLSHGTSNIQVTIQADRQSDMSQCRILANSNPANDYFVPARTAMEWNAFLNNMPPGVTASACITYAWGPWGACSASCGGGVETRSCNGSNGSVNNAPSLCGGGLASQSCNTQVCVCSPASVANGTVGSWPECTITCDTGYTLSGGSCVSGVCNPATVKNGIVAPWPSCAITCPPVWSGGQARGEWEIYHYNPATQTCVQNSWTHGDGH